MGVDDTEIAVEDDPKFKVLLSLVCTLQSKPGIWWIAG